jgi:hypothetical protein
MIPSDVTAMRSNLADFMHPGRAPLSEPVGTSHFPPIRAAIEANLAGKRQKEVREKKGTRGSEKQQGQDPRTEH